jgi:hypothetical protein
MRRLAAAALVALFAAAAAPQDRPQDAPRRAREARFEVLDVYLDPAGQPLAAWQVELELRRGDARIAGVEGGAHPAFREAPYYDPAARMGGRIVLAAFCTATNLPRARTRVARLHLYVTGELEPRFDLRVAVCATVDGVAIPARAELETARREDDR